MLARDDKTDKNKKRPTHPRLLPYFLSMPMVQEYTIEIEYKYVSTVVYQIA